MTQYYPNAIQIVDWYPACQHLRTVAEELLPSEKDDWLTEMKTLLWEGQIEVIIQECRSLFKQVGCPAKRLISYYTIISNGCNMLSL